MTNKFSTSVNIIRDTARKIDYIPTPNARQVVNQIVNDFKNGIRSFNIIGTYGTGKSSFLVALEQSINGTRRYFEPNLLPNQKVEFIKIIGSYTSIVEQFADIFNIVSNKNVQENILSEIFNKYYLQDKDAGILFLLVDEFGKFLEYASKHNPESELYFIQQLAEFCNNPKYNIVLITTVHQNFESYAYSLSSTQKQEWTKVKGRFREITFNEPVEQLLFLASEFVDAKKDIKSPQTEIVKCLKLAELSQAFRFNRDFINNIAIKLFPLDIIAANTLTLSLQRYGQNERSLFSFLESTDHTGLYHFNKNDNPFYNLSCVFDYLNFNFYSYLSSKFNPDFFAWTSIKSSLEKVERAFDFEIEDYSKTIKVIGLLNIFASSGAILDKEFFSEYLKVACGIRNANQIIDNLENKRIIRYRAHSKRYILFDGTDLDIQTALIEAGNKISQIGDITSLLNKFFKFNVAYAKLYSYERGTPRIFEFQISEYPISKTPTGEIDGYINLIFNSKIDIYEIESVSEDQKEAIIYCYFKNSTEIKSLLFEIEKTKKVLEENRDDSVAKRELENIVESQIRLLNHFINDSIFNGSQDVIWIYRGNTRDIKNKRDFNKLLSQVCNEVYFATPIFKNELVNKHKISTSIHTAKRNYFRALANNWDKENLGFEDGKFPPEKTIYLTLLKENGISPIRDDSFEIASIGVESSFYNLWMVSNRFLESAKTEYKKISEFVDVLNVKPLKLKQGFIDFWVPSFLFIKRDEFAIFNDEGYIANLSEENLELIAKYPEKYSIKTFDIGGVKLDIFNSYRSFLNQQEKRNINNEAFIETIKPFITFYKGLPEYSKQTKRLSTSALKIRLAIENSINPEETFFEAFPNALGTTLTTLHSDISKLQDFTTKLQVAVRELRTSYDELVKRFEDFICNEFIGEPVEFEVYKQHLQKRYSKLKKHLLLSNQRTFVQRIDSRLDDKKSWLNSITQAVIGKTLETISDEDEILLYDKFKSIILELDSLTNLSKEEVDFENEEVIGVKIDSFFTTINPKIVRVPKSKLREIEEVKIALKEKLGSDKTSNIAAVLNLLKELLK